MSRERILVLGEGKLAESVCRRLAPFGGIDLIDGSAWRLRNIINTRGTVQVIVEEKAGGGQRAGQRCFKGSILVLALSPAAAFPGFAQTASQKGLPVISLLELSSRLGIDCLSTQPPQIEEPVDDVDKMAVSVSLVVDSEGPGSLIPTRNALRCALELARRGCEVTVFHRALALGGRGTDFLYNESRDTGIRFIRCQEPPKILKNPGGGLTLKFFDSSLSERFPLQVESELVAVAEEHLLPAEQNKLFELLGWDKHLGGRLLDDNNIHYWGQSSPRKGLYWVTPEAWEEQLDVIIDSLKDAVSKKMETGHPLQVDPYRCQLCLTCFRVCPHGAIEIADYPDRVERGQMYRSAARINQERCWECGICLSECPALAISRQEVGPEPLLLAVDGRGNLVRVGDGASSLHAPIKLVAFACANSGYLAVKDIIADRSGPERSGTDDWLALVEVRPVACAGRVSALDACREFVGGTDGIIVWSCHQKACRHLWGNRRLSKIWERLCSELKSVAGKEPPLLVQPVASMQTGVIKASINRILLDISQSQGG